MNLNKIEKLYTQNLETYGIDSRAVGWNSPESQNLRFEKLMFLVENNSKPFSINELGCGYGELYKYLEKHKFNFAEFNGYDISQPMLDSCKDYLMNPNNLFLYNSSKLSSSADYSITSGIFNTPFDYSEDKWKKYIKDTIVNLYDNSLKGIAFNFLTSYVDFRSESLYYQDPAEMLAFCLENFGKNVKLIHDYPLYEFTILIFKNQA